MTIEKQLKAVKEVKDSFIADYKKYPPSYMGGLCIYFYNVEEIKLFTFENAVKHANVDVTSDPNGYWWKVIANDYKNIGQINLTYDTYDYENRILFLNWMIKSYKRKLFWKRLISKFKNYDNKG